ncbi:hypothetical protein AK812_SmicGene10462 [Symbiodinium microadriaticum]|uniref:Uncharacterized protein n=1 Tax=Symbiodinium microadriaticum TaxID=2951 RepID=A0A1Q9EFP6_SYMMI|nr:hypothetical protein AK812_SmicGene10462 [Symbiodinium microadriaticum]
MAGLGWAGWLGGHEIYGAGETQQIEVLLDEVFATFPANLEEFGFQRYQEPPDSSGVSRADSLTAGSLDALAAAQRGGGAQQREARPPAQDTELAADEMVRGPGAHWVMAVPGPEVLGGGPQKEPRGNGSDRHGPVMKTAAAISWEFGIWLTGWSGKEDGQSGQDDAE